MDYDKTPRGRWLKRMAVVWTLFLAAMLIVCIVSIQSNWDAVKEYRAVARATPGGLPVMRVLDDGSIVAYNRPMLIDFSVAISVTTAAVVVIGVDLVRNRERRRFSESTEKTDSAAGE